MMKTEGGSPSYGGSGYMDDEFYEDTGELSLPREGEEKHVMLTRIPEWLYEHIANWDELSQGNDNDQIVLGEVLSLPEGNTYDQKKAQPKDGKKPVPQPQAQTQGPPKPPSMRIFFNNSWRERSQLPTAFEIEGQSTHDTVLKNTYIFTEKDLPGYKHHGVGRNKAGFNDGAVQDPNSRVSKGPRQKFKKAIPKQTALIGSASTQHTASPLNTAEFITFNAQRTKEAIQGRNSHTNIMDEVVDEVTVMNNLQDSFTSFIKSDKKPKSQLNKYNRLPRNELLDLMHEGFDRYEYWKMSTLKSTYKQPEAYLKEVLPSIAVLIKSGHFAGKWKRLDIFGRKSQYAGAADDFVKEEEASEGAVEDEDQDMEDVL